MITYERITIRRQKYEIVIHGVLNEDLDDSNTPIDYIIRDIEMDNKDKNIKIIKITSLR